MANRALFSEPEGISAIGDKIIVWLASYLCDLFFPFEVFMGIGCGHFVGCGHFGS